MQIIKNKPVFLILVILAFISSILILWRYLIPKEVRVLEVSPQVGATEVGVNSQIKVRFNSPVDAFKLSILTKPNIVGQSGLDQAKTNFTFIPENQFSYQTVYSIEIYYQNRSLFSWQFTTEKEEEKQIKARLIELLPVNNENFSIEYFPTSQKFIITIKKSPYSQNKQRALDWFRDNGVEDPEKTLDIFVSSARWIGD